MPKSEKEKLDTAIAAVRHTLIRISQDPKLSYPLGDCTEAYHLLCQAMADYNGRSLEDIKAEFAPALQPHPRASSQIGNDETLTLLQRQVSETLNVAPYIAAFVIAHARRRGIRLSPHPIERDGYIPDTADFDCQVVKAWQSYAAWLDDKKSRIA